MKKSILNPPNLVKPAGYSHAVSTEGGKLVFLAGQLGVDSEGKVTAPGDLVRQFNQALTNLQSVIEYAGGTATDIVKLNIYITDKTAYMENLKPLGKAYLTVFGHYFPAITLLEVKSLFDDQALVEIEGMAVIK